MYLWKAWHDARGRLLMYVCAGAALGLLYGSFAWADAQFILRWRYLTTKPFPPDLPARIAAMDVGALQIPLTLAAMWAALVLGSSTVGENYGDRTMEFVVSRPLARWRMVATE